MKKRQIRERIPDSCGGALNKLSQERACLMVTLHSRRREGCKIALISAPKNHHSTGSHTRSVWLRVISPETKATANRSDVPRRGE